MKTILLCTVWAFICSGQGVTFAVQTPLLSTTQGSIIETEQSKARKLHGRFLHITDIHPDPFYKFHSSTEEDSACHRYDGPAGYYGAETTDCDTPLSLVNATFQWMADNLKDNVDFVIWTGDSARHDNDENFPRSEEQVLKSNNMLVNKMKEVFGRTSRDSPRTGAFLIPIIPTFGNNDILPHNIFSKGPNRWTKNYLQVWRDIIPEEQRHGFDRGGWFYVEVIPNKLAVFSLNTMYFFESNSAVDGCAVRREPGYQHMEWLRIQLSFLRLRGMKAILTGHVPPARTSEKSTWDETCWQKYTLWMQQYRDVVVGSIYGHMNVEHFLLHDFHDINLDLAMGNKDIGNDIMGRDESGNVNISVNAPDYLSSLRRQWAKLPAVPSSLQAGSSKHTNDTRRDKDRLAEEQKFFKEIGGQYAERFSVSQVASSVVPNYFPALRVYEYNISGLESLRLYESWSSHPAPETDEFLNGADLDAEECPEVLELRNKNLLPEDLYFTVPQPPSKNAPPGPAYSPQTLSLTGYKQYYSNLTYINNDFALNSTYLPRTADTISASRGKRGHREEIATIFAKAIGGLRWRNGKHHDREPHHPPPNPLNFTFEIEYNTRNKSDTYGFSDGLTVRNWVELAATIGEWKSDIKLTLSQKGDTAELDDNESYASVLGSTTDKDSENGANNAENRHYSNEDEDQWREKKKKKHNKHKGSLSKRRRKQIEDTWLAFISRGVVGSMEAEELQEKSDC